jgi:hypothetical protein
MNINFVSFLNFHKINVFVIIESLVNDKLERDGVLLPFSSDGAKNTICQITVDNLGMHAFLGLSPEVLITFAGSV